jgi:hypothetical protein
MIPIGTPEHYPLKTIVALEGAEKYVQAECGEFNESVHKGKPLH